MREFSNRPEKPIVGVGTVLTEDVAVRALEAGARFLVSPIVDPEIIRFCVKRDVVSMPGTCTPTEMVMAVRAGADVCKLFPSGEKGPDYCRAVLGPLPKVRARNIHEHKCSILREEIYMWCV